MRAFLRPSVLLLGLLGCGGGGVGAGATGGAGTTGTAGHLTAVTGRRVGATCPAHPGLPPLVDECLADWACPTGQACLCASQQLGNAVHVNRCVPSGCRVDTDCVRGVCVLAQSQCWSLGYQCATAADECHVDEDCPRAVDAGPTTQTACRWTPEVGRFQCATIDLCPAG